MSVFQRWFPIALGAACLLGCGDDSNTSPSDDGGTVLDSSINPIEGDGDGDVGDGDSGDGDVGPGTDHDASNTDAGAHHDASVNPKPPHDAGTPTPPDAGKPDTGTPKGTPVFVAVGYAGRRVRSTDLGVTWTDEEFLDPAQRGGDDEYLLRGVTYAKGVFVAVGWKIMTSKDGRKGTWTDHTIPGQQWLAGIQFGNDRFVATGGYGYSARSSDGLSWTKAGDLNTQASRSLAFGNGKFTSATDQGNWWTSTDGATWTQASGGHTNQVAYCSDFKNYDDCSGTFSARNRAVGEGVTVRINSSGRLERSTNGVNFTTVLNSGLGFEGVSFGYVE
ncbi:MAG: hypothetical protein QM778_07790 [Myxococcales bacterium]